MRFLLAFVLCLLFSPAAAEEAKLAVISDINSTIRSGGAVPGMAEAYKKLAKQGASFHYISYATWAEEGEIRSFIAKEGFPEGSLHLRESRGGFFGFGQSPGDTKPPAIRKLLAEHPARDFILVGDSGWQDPEIYGAIAREHPERIRHIYIRRVTSEAPRDARFKKAFSGLNDAQWTVFTDPQEIKAD